MKTFINDGYAKTTKGGKRVHRELMRPILLDALEELFPDKEWDIHHKDGNKLNNDILNLLILEHDEHTRLHRKEIDYRLNVSRKMRGKTKNEFPYTTRMKSHNPEQRCWNSRIRWLGKNKSLGVYEDPYTASLVAKLVLKIIDDEVEV